MTTRIKHLKRGDVVRSLPGSSFGDHMPGDVGIIVQVPSSYTAGGCAPYSFDVQFLIPAGDSDDDGVWPGDEEEVELINEETT